MTFFAMLELIVALLVAVLLLQIAILWRVWVFHKTKHYDREGSLARDAISHAEQVSIGNVKRYGKDATMDADDKMRNALDYGRLHWHGPGKFDEARFRRRLESELGKKSG